MASNDLATFTQCQHCGKTSSPTQRIRACTRCFTVGYCTVACQRADWKGKDGHKFQCHPTSKPTRVVGPLPKEDKEVVRLEVKRGDEDVWDDVGPINLVEDMANATINSNKSEDNRAAPATKSTYTKPNLTKAKDLPKSAQRILGPESSDTYKYRHSPDGVDENLIIFFHGAGGSHLAFDTLGQKMELPQTAVLTISAYSSMNLPGKKDKKETAFVEIPFGFGPTWFDEMDYLTGDAMPKDHPRRLKSLKHAVKLLDPLLCSLTGIGSEGSNVRDDATWIPERIFLFGFSAGGCLVMELCRMWMNAGRMPLGGAICIAGGIKTKGQLPGMKRKDDKEQTSSTRQNEPTNVLIITGSEDTTYPKEAAQLSKEFYHPSKVQIHVQKGKGHTMIESKDEMQVVMEFLSKRLVKRMISMEGMSR